VKRLSTPPYLFFRNFCATLLILDPPKLGSNNEVYNVFALGCLGYVEPNNVMIVSVKPLMKLRFGFGIIP
jgi:hypothetical protein